MNDRTIIRTRTGQVRGEERGAVFRFGAIPFADRIDGEGRFRPARPMPAWDGVRDARALSPRVPQVRDPDETALSEYHEFLFGPFHDSPMSEAGLFLNLWTPDPDPDARLPVMVWIHGGGFAVGGPTRMREEATRLAERGVVVVSPSHRLGVSGYAHLAPFDPEGGWVPNVGLTDIVAALDWVQDNIVSFGGDPSRVTVFGESGGSIKSTTLLGVPQAQDKFHRVIGHAGVVVSDFGFSPMDEARATVETRRFLEALGADLANPGPRIASASMEDIIAADTASGAGLMRWAPLLDGDVLLCEPGHAARAGLSRDVPVMIGCTTHEFDMFRKGEGFPQPESADDLTDDLGDAAWSLVDSYARLGDDAPAKVVEDRMFRMPGLRFAEARADADQPTWRYLFDFNRFDDPTIRATHGGETPFVFGTSALCAWSSGDPAEAQLTGQFQDAWVSFAATGDPGAHWPPYDPDTGRAVMVFGRDSAVAFDPDDWRRAAWDAAISRPRIWPLREGADTEENPRHQGGNDR